MKKIIILYGLAIGSVLAQPTPRSNPAAMNLFIDRLLKQMTVEEKVGQLTLFTSDMDVTGPTLRSTYKEDIQKGRCGAIFNAYSPPYVRQLQDLAVKQSRLKIPLLFGYDVIHGHRTIFPIPLGEACTWDMGLMEKTARAAAVEASADGLHWTYSPMVDIARDPRWGRVAEGVGEDTWFGEQVARAKVRGYQGDLTKPDQVLASVKHFALYGAIQAGRDYNTVDMSHREMFQTYLPPYKAAVDAGAATVMTSFNEVDGIPATANRWLMTDLLRKQWGFKGFVVTDYTAINEMIQHGVGANEYEVGALALRAGVDMDMQGDVYRTQLPKLLADKKITMQELDAATRRVLEAKYRLGLFQDPYKYISEERAQREIMSADKLELAREVARKSIVLLKNEAVAGNPVLPLKKSGTIALIGPLADNKRDMIGNWSAAGDWQKAVSLREGLQTKLGNSATILYAKGANLIDDKELVTKLNNNGGNISTDEKTPEQLIAEAVATAQKADVVVMAIGESQGMTGEAASRSEIGIPENQRKLLEAILATKKPVAVVLMNGRPLTLEWEHQHVPALLETWFLGTQAGHAIADVLVGDYNPAGKLTMTFPRRVGQIPVYYNAKNTGRPIDPNNKYTSKYLDVPNTPLYPFGYGLSYTNFSYSDITLNNPTLTATGKLEVSVTVKNTGQYAGEEVVQLYIRDLVGSVTRPLKELKGFQKISLKPGESRNVTFTLKEADLRFYDAAMKWTSEPGDFTVFVGTNSQEVKEARFKLVR
ncbi:beta-glucosidase BglX [Larkinella insperata]|uniref:beta-glucosidase n=1 Tax=Larkinella insperata TaxID=332158 RepID=A0ABW3QEA1_9BACT|nr:beta-glucosidase BglX [Larkinella insperata]